MQHTVNADRNEDTRVDIYLGADCPICGQRTTVVYYDSGDSDIIDCCEHYDSEGDEFDTGTLTFFLNDGNINDNVRNSAVLEINEP